MNNYKGSWQCPYCEHFATISDNDTFKAQGRIPNRLQADITYLLETFSCPNSLCGQLSIQISIKDNTRIAPIITPSEGGIPPGLADNYKKHPVVNLQTRLLPKSKAKSFPKYIPSSIINDYEEAYLIMDSSPKSSATLARRCLRTIIRDFYNIKEERNLYDEIEALSKAKSVDSSVLMAFHDLRNIGNIGAHMEKDVNLILDISAEEASILIKFIENILELTYIQAHTKDELLRQLSTINSKNITKKNTDI